MAHSSMYDLQNHLIGDIADLERRAQHHRYEADQLDHRREQRKRQLQVLTEQIERVNAYEAEQRAEDLKTEPGEV